jgi:hypothetical protein
MIDARLESLSIVPDIDTVHPQINLFGLRVDEVSGDGS